MRKSISTRTRFEIFKRDGFTCQYCGRTPPAIVLHCDHILAVSKGGKNDVSNLIASCQDCNLGKSDVALGKTRIPILPCLKAEREKLIQLRAYEEFLQERANVDEERFRIVSDKWIALDGKEPLDFIIAGERALAVRKFLIRLPVPEIVEALELAYLAEFHGESRRFKYFCGICWNKINRKTSN